MGWIVHQARGVLPCLLVLGGLFCRAEWRYPIAAPSSMATDFFSIVPIYLIDARASSCKAIQYNRQINLYIIKRMLLRFKETRKMDMYGVGLHCPT